MKLIPNAYPEGSYTMVADRPDRHDPSEAEREADRAAGRIDGDDVCKALGITNDDLDAAIDKLKFPQRLGLRQTGFMIKKTVAFWSRSQIREWQASVLQLASKFKKEI